MAQDSSQHASKRLPHRLKTLQEAKEPPKEAPERPKCIKNLRNINVFRFLSFSLPMGF